MIKVIPLPITVTLVNVIASCSDFFCQRAKVACSCYKKLKKLNVYHVFTEKTTAPINPLTHKNAAVWSHRSS